MPREGFVCREERRRATRQTKRWPNVSHNDRDRSFVAVHQSVESEIGFIGTANMGGMLIRALVQGGSIAPGNIWAANRSPARLDSLATEFTGLHSADSSRVAAASKVLFLCVKPADVPDVL